MSIKADGMDKEINFESKQGLDRGAGHAGRAAAWRVGSVGPTGADKETAGRSIQL